MMLLTTLFFVQICTGVAYISRFHNITLLKPHHVLFVVCIYNTFSMIIDTMKYLGLSIHWIENKRSAPQKLWGTLKTNFYLMLL